jgi:REP element-mobilizing transposase RayT
MKPSWGYAGASPTLYEIKFIAIGADRDHVHFLIQSVPMYSPAQIARTAKSISGRELFARMPTLGWAL